MKTHLNLIYNNQEIRLTAHDLLYASREVVQAKWKIAERMNRKLDSDEAAVNKSKFSNLCMMGNRTIDWLKAAESIKQGTTQNIAQKNYKDYADNINDTAVNLFREVHSKFDLSTERGNKLPKEIFDFASTAINEEVKESQVLENENAINNTKSRLTSINEYLDKIDPTKPPFWAGLKVSVPEESIDFLEKVEAVFCNQEIDSYIQSKRLKILKDVANFLNRSNTKTEKSLEECIQIIEAYLSPSQLNDVSFWELKYKALVYSKVEEACGFSNQVYRIRLEDLYESSLDKTDADNEKLTKSREKELEEKIINFLNIESKKFYEKKEELYKKDKRLQKISPFIKKLKLYNAVSFVQALIAKKKISAPNPSNDPQKYCKVLLEWSHKLYQNDLFNINDLIILANIVRFKTNSILEQADIDTIFSALLENILQDFRKNPNPVKATRSFFCPSNREIVSAIMPQIPIVSRNAQFEFYRIADRAIQITNHGDRYVKDCGDRHQSFKILDECEKGINDLCNGILYNKKSQISLKEWDFLSKLIIVVTKIKNYDPALVDMLENFNQLTIEYLKSNECTEKEMFMGYCISIFLRMPRQWEIGRLVEQIHSEAVSKSGRLSYLDFYQKLKEVYPHGIDSSKIAEEIRNILKNDKKSIETTPILPSLVATWFVAEPSRNPHSFLSGLMLLDMIEMRESYSIGNHKPYKWQNVLWHPKTIDLTEISAKERTEKNPQEDCWGGKHSMTRLGSFTDTFEKNLWPSFDDQKDENLPPSLKVVYQKEASILINWLNFRINLLLNNKKLPTISQSRITKISKKHKIKPETVVSGRKKIPFKSYIIKPSYGPTAKNKYEVITEIIKPLLEYRIINFDNQLSNNSLSDLSEITDSIFDWSMKYSLQTLLRGR
jgi:hypothetical protein